MAALADVMATFVWADGAEQAADLLPQLRHRTRPGEAQQRLALGQHPLHGLMWMVRGELMGAQA